MKKGLPSVLKRFPVGLIAVAIIAFSYVYPRLLIEYLGESNPWTSYLYMYGLGLVCFLTGLLLILKTKACQLGRGHDTFWFKVLVFGYVFFATLHGTWIYLAISLPVKGG